MSSYYYSDAKQQAVGPLTFDELQSLAQAGTITAATLVIEHGAQVWKTWGEIEATQRPAEPPPLAAAPVAAPAAPYTPAAQVMAEQARHVGIQVQDSLSRIAWGAMFYGLLLVILQCFVLPATIIYKALLDLSVWGKAGQLPTSTSDVPVLTFLVVVLRPPVIILYLIISALWLLIFLLISNSAAEEMGAGMGIGTRIFLFILGLIGIYFYTTVIALVFDLLSLGIRMANNLKKIADKY